MDPEPQQTGACQLGVLEDQRTVDEDRKDLTGHKLRQRGNRKSMLLFWKNVPIFGICSNLHKFLALPTNSH